jgi:hypothetical protein
MDKLSEKITSIADTMPKEGRISIILQNGARRPHCTTAEGGRARGEAAARRGLVAPRELRPIATLKNAWRSAFR